MTLVATARVVAADSAAAFVNQRHEILNRRRTGKCDPIRPSILRRQCCPQPLPRGRRNHSLVSLNHVHPRTQLAQLPRNHVARDLRPRQQHPLPFYIPPQARHHRFRHILLGHNADLHTMLLDGLPGRRSDRSDFEMTHRLSTQVKLSQPLPQRVDSVDAGQNEPVVL